MDDKIHEAKLRYENSKILFERAAFIYAKDLNAYVAACLDKPKGSTPSGQGEHKGACPKCGCEETNSRGLWTCEYRGCQMSDCPHVSFNDDGTCKACAHYDSTKDKESPNFGIESGEVDEADPRHIINSDRDA